MRWDIINTLIEKNNYKSYLEIGYYKGWSFDQVKCEDKTAVDPNPSKTPFQEKAPYGYVEHISSFPWRGVVHKETSDDFFKKEDKINQGIGGAVDRHRQWDIVFIDGLHEAEQVYRDIQNSINHLAPGGTIVMHDCSPPTEEHTTIGVDGCWTGDTYKAVLKFRNESYGTWSFRCVDTDWGVGIIQKENPTFDSLLPFLHGFPNYEDTWEFFDKRRKDLLTLITVDQFKHRYL
jgi:hypothetical protein